MCELIPVETPEIDAPSEVEAFVIFVLAVFTLVPIVASVAPRDDEALEILVFAVLTLVPTVANVVPG